MEIGFGEALLIVGGLLAVVAALSGLMRGTVLSASVLSVLLGIVLAELEVISIDVGDDGVLELIELALILTLVSDGLVVERELLGRHWSPVARALVVAMPITLALLALGAKLLFNELSWAEAFLLGAVLSPTDPVVTSTVVTAQRVPAAIRHTLNLESGLNDGLALPFVLFFLVLATPGGRRRRRGRAAGRRGRVRRRDRDRARADRRPASPGRPGWGDRRATRASTRSASGSPPSGSPTSPSATA